MLKQSAIESAYSKERKQRRHAQSEMQELKKRAEALETCEAQLKKWEQRKERIYGLCDTVGKLKKYVKSKADQSLMLTVHRDNEDMRQELLRIGYEVPPKTYDFEAKQTSQANRSDLDHERMKERLDALAVNGDSTGNHISTSLWIVYANSRRLA